MADYYFSLGEIRVQKDEFKVAGIRMDEREFLNAVAKQADDVVHFKRFKVLDCRLHSPELGVTYEFEILVNIRSQTVKFVCTGGRIRAADIFNLLAPALRRFVHQEPDQTRRRPLESIFTSTDGKQQLCSTFDGYWFANVLHEIRDLKNYKLEPT